jgi:hypothetical protein
MRVTPNKVPRVPLGTRLTPQMKESLIAAAQRNGRSVTQEVELRLEIADLVIRQSRGAAA